MMANGELMIGDDTYEIRKAGWRASYSYLPN